MTISKYTNYAGCVGVGKLLHVGDTVTSPDGAYVLEVVSTGLILTFQGQNPVTLVGGLDNVTGARLTASSFVIYTTTEGAYVCSFPGLDAVRICVEDNGEVLVFDLASDYYILFSYNQDLVLVSRSAFSAAEEAFSNAQMKFRVLSQTMRRVSLSVEDEKEVPKQSGFPGANDSASEKVA